jgi:hypothetical protein
LHVTFGLIVENLWSIEDFSLASYMLSTTVNVAKSTQNCQNLPKFAQRKNFEIPPKIEILVFSKNKYFYL